MLIKYYIICNKRNLMEESTFRSIEEMQDLEKYLHHIDIELNRSKISILKPVTVSAPPQNKLGIKDQINRKKQPNQAAVH